MDSTRRGSKVVVYQLNELDKLSVRSASDSILVSIKCDIDRTFGSEDMIIKVGFTATNSLLQQ